MNTKEARNIKEILDPHSKYIFFDDEGMTEAFPVCKVEKNTIVAGDNALRPINRERSGYFVAVGGKGIVRFSGEVRSSKRKKGEQNGFLRIDIRMDALKLIDRREFHRRHFKRPTPVYLKCEGKFVRASMINLSEGGLRMTVKRRLPTQVVYRFEMTLPGKNGGKINFNTDGLVVYCEPEEDPSLFVAGIALIAPHFDSEKEKVEYQKARTELASFLLDQPKATS